LGARRIAISNDWKIGSEIILPAPAGLAGKG
jgi:hypothetical protein